MASVFSGPSGRLPKGPQVDVLVDRLLQGSNFRSRYGIRLAGLFGTAVGGIPARAAATLDGSAPLLSGTSFGNVPGVFKLPSLDSSAPTGMIAMFGPHMASSLLAVAAFQKQATTSQSKNSTLPLPWAAHGSLHVSTNGA